MRLWIQAILAIGLGAAGVVAVAHQVPAARPALEQAGILPFLDRVGLAPAFEASAATPAGQGGPRGPGGAASVIAIQPEAVALITEVAAIGTGTARRAVEVRPEVSGRLAEVMVSSGQRVSAGDILARLDAESEDIAVTRAQLVLGDAEAQYERLSRLVTSGSASEFQLGGAELALRQAELAARQATFELERRTIRAPISGLAGIVDRGPGDQIAASDTLTRIDDREEILIDFSIPERFVSLLNLGSEVEVTPLARPELRLDGRIAAIENRVDPATRAIRLRAAIGNENDTLRSGMAFSIRMSFEGDTYPAVDPLAIQWSAEGAFVWAARDERAVRVPVQIMQRGAQRVLVRADFEPGDLVVTEGVQALRPGAPVAVQSTEQQG
ncbi:MAG: efflux RND transporter periplasmic adaptor subunit [Pararhodobacter sp.]